MKYTVKFLCLVLALIFALPSCSSSLTITEEEKPKTQTEEATEETAEEEEMEETKVEQETEKEEEKKPAIMQKDDPKKDDVINLLMIGNSFCYYYVEELYGMAKEAGIQMKIYNLYYSGCTVPKHWNWFLEDESPYQLITTDDKGRRSKKDVSLRTALKQENWDMISLQSTGGTVGAAMMDDASVQKTKETVLPIVKKLYDYIRGQFPQSQLYWQETWAFQVGYNRSNGTVETKEIQDRQRLVIQTIQRPILTENNVKLIPTGEAWYLARQNPVVGDNLCARLGVKEDKGDNYHDGDIGGGQYVNACTWFEVLTGKSCLGNAYRPDYELSEEKIAALQQAAHKAVADVYGENYAK